MAEKIPTLEEFKEAVVKIFLEDHVPKGCEDRAKEFLASKDAEDLAREGYEHTVWQYKDGERTIEDFYGHNARAVAYEFRMMY